MLAKQWRKTLVVYLLFHCFTFFNKNYLIDLIDTLIYILYKAVFLVDLKI